MAQLPPDWYEQLQQLRREQSSKRQQPFLQIPVPSPIPPEEPEEPDENPRVIVIDI